MWNKSVKMAVQTKVQLCNHYAPTEIAGVYWNAMSVRRSVGLDQIFSDFFFELSLLDSSVILVEI